MWGQLAIERTCFSSTEIQLEAGVGRWAHRGPQAKPVTSKVFRNLHFQFVHTTPYQVRPQHMNCLLSVIMLLAPAVEERPAAKQAATCPKYKEAARVACYRASQTRFADANLTHSLVLFCCTGVQVSCWKQLWPAQQRMASQMQNWDKLVLLD